MVLALVVVNILVFVLLNVTAAFITMPVQLIALPASVKELLRSPWTIISYMFTQWDFMHLLINMLWLWLWSRVVCIGGRQMLISYIAGGLGGALIYIVASLAGFDCGMWLVGSSAAVCGFIVYSAIVNSHRTVEFVFFGNVKIGIAAVVVVMLCLMGDINGNIGTAAAHLGGVISGAVYGFVFRAMDKCRLKVNKVAQNKDIDNKEVLDALLAKVSCSGFNSLTEIERRTLFDISRRLGK